MICRVGLDVPWHSGGSPTAEMHGQHGSVPGTGEQTEQQLGGIKLRLSKINIVTIQKPCKESRKFRLYLLHV